MEGIDGEIVRRAQRGDRDAMTVLITTLSPAIFRFVRRLTRSEEDAQELTQETFLRVVDHFDQYDPGQRFSTWVFRIARNLTIDRSRRANRWRRFFSRAKDDEEEGDPMDTLAADLTSQLDELLLEERDEAIDRALGALKPSYREVLVLFHFEDQSYQDIASILSLPIGTVMTRIFRARQQLRMSLQPMLAAA